MRVSCIFVFLAVALVSGCTKHTMISRATLAHPTMSPDELYVGMDGTVRAHVEVSALRPTSSPVRD